MLRVVLDTNVLVSAIISNGKSRELLKKGITNHYSILISDLILKERGTAVTAVATGNYNCQKKS
jgi:putative PIN family toxin of toxin-antitoxin system